MDEIEMEKRIEDRINMYHDSQTSFDELVGYIIILEAENKRLRKALEEIRDAKPAIRDTISEFSGTPAFYYVPPAPTKLQEIARQALEGGSD